MKLYRFEKLTEERVDTIRRGFLWCASPSNFDDFADCRLHLSIEDHPEWATDCVLTLAEKLADSSPIGPMTAMRLIDLIRIHREPDKDVDDILESMWTQNEIRDKIRKTTEVCCFFQAPPESPVMWAHYANGHKGFCVEYSFNTDSDDHGTLFFPVNYSTRIITVSAVELLLSPTIATEKITTSKGSAWAYEREWRLVRPSALPVVREGTGEEIQRPSTLRPTRILAGAKVKRSEQGELEALAHSLEVPMCQVLPVDGLLKVSEQEDDPP